MPHIRDRRDFFTTLYSRGSSEDLEGAVIEHENLAYADLSHRSIAGTTFRRCNLRGAAWHGVRVDARTVLEDCVLDDAIRPWLEEQIRYAKERQAEFDARVAEVDRAEMKGA